MRKKILRFTWVIGLFLFVFLIYKIGPNLILTNIKSLALKNFLILLLLRFHYWIFRTFSWKIVSDTYGDKISFIRLFSARMAGHAISHLTPSSQIGGEAVRTMILKTPNRKKALASVVVDKTLEIMTGVCLAIVGFSIAIFQVFMPKEYKLVFVGFLLIMSLLMALILEKQKRGFFIWIIGAMEKIKIKFHIIDKHREKINETDAYISNFYQKHKSPFLQVFVLHCFCVLFWAAEIWMTLRFLGVEDVSVLESFLIVTLGTIAFILPTVPASLGTYDVTFVALFALFGIETNLGMTVVLIRRILALFWAGVGLIVMALGREKPSR